MKRADFIVRPEWLISVEDTDPDKGLAVKTGHSIAVTDGLIAAIGPCSEVDAQWSADQQVELSQQVLIPGMVNAHTHAAMTLLRGYADDLPLMQWLSDHIWPAESKWVDESFIGVGTDLAIAEMILGGTTCFNDMYFFPDVTAKHAERAGMRAVVGMIVIDFPTVWANDADEYISKGLAMRDGIRHSGLVSAAFAPHAPYTVSDQPLERIALLSDELDCPVHMHVHETAHEVEESVARYQMRPLERLDQIGLLTPRMAAVHMTQLMPQEIETIAERGINIVHCPQSNLKLASGMSKIQAMLETGINIAIGTDGASSNNDLDMLDETRTASLLAKGVSENPSAFTAGQSLYSATMGGAIALGLEQRTGSLTPGKAADMVAIDLTHPSTQPVFNPLSQIIYSASRSQISNVWINGKRLLEQGNLTTIDQLKTVADAQQWGLKMSGADGS